jgi:hypothetical protein
MKTYRPRPDNTCRHAGLRSIRPTCRPQRRRAGSASVLPKGNACVADERRVPLELSGPRLYKRARTCEAKSGQTASPPRPKGPSVGHSANAEGVAQRSPGARSAPWEIDR